MNTALPLVTECVAFHYCHETYGAAVGQPRRAAQGLHIHPFYQLDLFPEGGVTVFLEGRPPLPAQPWNGLLIPPMTGHGYASSRTALVITFKFHLHPRYWLQFGDTGGFVDFPEWYGAMAREAWELSKSDPVLHAHHVVSATTICLTHWLRSQPPEPPPHEVRSPWGRHIRSVLEMIAADPCKPWTVAALAWQCHVSPDHFCRRFLSLVGKPPQRFLLELRLRTAAMRLVHEDAPIKEVSREVGYATVHSFTRAFSRVFGTSPGAYVKTVPRQG